MRDLIQIGIDHLTAPMHYRERLAGSGQPAAETLEELRREAALDEVVLLSTCSRFEVFARSAAPEASLAATKAWFDRRLGGDAGGCLATRQGQDVAAHLFRVAAGLDSWILGESEILSQVKGAYQGALAGGFTGPRLNRIFQSAIAAGKSARAKTGIQNGIHSIGGAAALLARRIFGDGGKGRTVVFGAGQAAEAVCRHLAAKNFDDVVIANRTLERAEALAREIGGRAVGLEEGLALLGDAEIAVFSISATEPVLSAPELKSRLSHRRKSLFLIDLGMPRNVAPECAALPSVYVYDLDDLKNVVGDSMARKAVAKDAAQAVIEEAVRECARQLEKASARSAQEALS